MEVIMRIAIGGIMHESNTFSSKPTDRAAFGVQRGEEILRVYRDAHHEVTGYIEGAEKFGFDVYPMLTSGATPSGAVTDEAFEELVSELIQQLQNAPQLDGLLLALHGAMVVESFPDGDGEVLRRLREVLGSEFPIVVTHDFHANISEQLVKHSTALIVYKTNPHVDQRQRGVQAAELITRIVRGEVKPTQALAKPPMMFNILYQNTSKEPLKPIMDAARELESNPKILAASVAAGYQYADVHEMGPTAVVVTNDDPTLAQREAQRLSDMLWNVREQLVINLPNAAEAVRMAIEDTQHATRNTQPVVLVEMGDNIGGGSSGDSTFILSELLKQETEGWVVVIADPEAVQECVKVVVRQSVILMVGGKMDKLHGRPVAIQGRLNCIHDGFYEETEARHGGKRYHDQGITAVVEIRNPQSTIRNLLVLTSKREPPFSLEQLRSLGIKPERQRILVVKAAVAFRAAYQPIAGRIIEVNTPGLTCIDPKQFTYRRVRRPLFGL
jgi:microcystin degradation protein MlrC